MKILAVILTTIIYIVLSFNILIGQTLKDISKIKIDTFYFTDKNEDLHPEINHKFSMMLKSGDEQTFVLHSPIDGKIYFTDTENRTFQTIQLNKLPKVLESFIPSNVVSYQSDKLRLWFNDYWIVITDLNQNYKSHIVSPYYTYREIFYKDYFEASEFKVNQNILFSSHPIKNFGSDYLNTKTSPSIVPNAVFAIISLESLLNKKPGDSLIISEFIESSFCKSNSVNDRATGGRHAGINPLENTIWFSDAGMNSLIAYSLTKNEYKCYDLPISPILTAPNWKKAKTFNSGSTLDYNGIITTEKNRSKNSVGLAWQFQWIISNESDKILYYWGIGSRNNELTKTLQNNSLFPGITHNKYLNTDDFVIYQYLSIEQPMRILWEVILPGDYAMSIASATENSIKFYKLIEKDNESVPVIISWNFQQ